MYIVKIMLQEMQICNVEKNPKDELTKTNASNPHEKQESEKESEFKSKIKYCETTEINKDDSVNLRSPSCALRSGNEEQRSELSPDVDGVSDSPYTSSNLITDGQPKVGRGLPSIDEKDKKVNNKSIYKRNQDDDLVRIPGKGWNYWFNEEREITG